MTNDQMTTVVNGVKMIFLPKPKNRFSRILFLTREAYKIALEEKADIYHFHDPEFLYWAVKLKQKTGAKVIYDVHEDFPQQILSKPWIPKIFRKLIATIFNFYEKRKVKQLDFIIVALPKVKESFQKTGINNIETITNYPLLEYFAQVTSNQRVATSNQRIKLIYVGGLTRIRGTIEIIKSLEFIKSDVKLILLGKFQEKDLENKLKKMPEWEKVEFKGWLPQKETYQNMMDADIGLICFLPTPNNINSMPNKLFEYMAARLPIIASDFPLWKEIIREDNCGLTVNPQEPREIAKTIDHLIEHPEEARIMGENGRRAVFKKYNWEKESQKLIKIYQQLTTKY